MREEYEKRLEADIDRELKGLPELIAPHTLVLRVMAAIEKRLNLPWYRRSWQMWPVGLQVISMGVLLAVFGGICFGTWKLTQLESFSSAMQQAGGWFSGIKALGHAAYVVFNAGILMMKHLGTGFIIACAVALALGYAACVSLGTLYVRLGLARR